MKVSIGAEERYFDRGLTLQLDALAQAVHQDWDGLMFFFGREGSGKTTFAFQIAKYLQPAWDLHLCSWTPKQFIDCVKRAKKYDVIVLDEAYLTFTNLNRLHSFQTTIISMLTMIRSKNLFIIIISPTFFDLNKYLVIHRSVAAFRIYSRGLERGFWEMYGEEAKLKLYIQGRKNNDLSVGKPDIRGRFTKWFPADKTRYDELKNAAVLELQETLEKKPEENILKIKKHRIEGAIWILKQVQFAGKLEYGGMKAACAALQMKSGNFNLKLTEYNRYSPFSTEILAETAETNYSSLKTDIPTESTNIKQKMDELRSKSAKMINITVESEETGEVE